MQARFPHAHALAVVAGCWFAGLGLTADLPEKTPDDAPASQPAKNPADPGRKTDNPVTLPPAGSCPAPAPPVLPPLAHPLPAPEPDGLWANLVALHNAYTTRLDMPWLCCPPAKDCGLHPFADAGFYFVQPAFESNPAFTFSHQSGTVVISNVVQRQQFEDDAAFAPRVAFGVTGDNGFGVRVSWWHFDQSSHPLRISNTSLTANNTISSASVAGLPGFTSPDTVARQFQVLADQMSFDSQLKLDTWDWEAIQDYHLGPWTVLLSGGVRYADLSQLYEAFRSNHGNGRSGTSTVNLVVDSDQIASGHDLAAVGPTGAVDIRRPFGDTAFALYGTARTAVLFGETHARAFQTNAVLGQIVPTRGRATPFASGTFTSDTSANRDVLPVEELEVGVEWAQCFRHFGAFVRTGLVGQVWFDAGNATDTSGNLGFFGLALTAGLDF